MFALKCMVISNFTHPLKLSDRHLFLLCCRTRGVFGIRLKHSNNRQYFITLHKTRGKSQVSITSLEKVGVKGTSSRDTLYFVRAKIRTATYIATKLSLNRNHFCNGSKIPPNCSFRKFACNNKPGTADSAALVNPEFWKNFGDIKIGNLEPISLCG